MVDALETMVTLLSNNWNITNTDNIKPQIGRITQYNRVDCKRSDYVLLYALTYTTRHAGIGGVDKNTLDVISIDTRSMVSYSHGLKVRDEVERILDANIKNPSSDYNELEPNKFEDKSDKSIGLFRWIGDVTLKRYGVSRT